METFTMADSPDDRLTMTFTKTVEVESPIVFVWSRSDTTFGHVVYMFMTFHALSIILSVAVIAIVISLVLISPTVAKRPSVRISAWIALIDIIISCLNFVKMTPTNYLGKQTETTWGVVFWLTYALPLIITLMTTCIAFHLMLTVLLKKNDLARRTNYFYEVFSVVFGLSISSICFGFYKNPIWEPFDFLFMFQSPPKHKTAVVLLYSFLWELLCIAFCIVVCGLLTMRLWPILFRMRQIDLDMPETDNYSGPYNVTSLRVPAGTGSGGGGGSNIYEKILRIGEKISLTIRSKKSPLFYTSSGNNGSSISRASTMVNAMNAPMPSPEKLGNCYIPIPGGPNPNHPYSSNPSSNTGNTNTNTSNNGQVNPVSFTTSKHCKQVRRTIQRILLYPVEIILFRLPYIIVMLSMVDENAGYITNTLISIHGIFNFAIFLINPGLEEFWFWFNSTIFGRHAKLQAQPVKFKPGC